MISEGQVEDYNLTLIDFNVAKRFWDAEDDSPILLLTNTGTPNYQSPEMFGGLGQSYDEKSDIWSMGAVLFYLATGGHHAFDQDDQEELKEAITAGEFNRALPEY